MLNSNRTLGNVLQGKLKRRDCESKMLRTDVKYERFRHENTQVYINGYTPRRKVRYEYLSYNKSLDKLSIAYILCHYIV